MDFRSRLPSGRMETALGSAPVRRQDTIRRAERQLPKSTAAWRGLVQDLGRVHHGARTIRLLLELALELVQGPDHKNWERNFGENSYLTQLIRPK